MRPWVIAPLAGLAAFCIAIVWQLIGLRLSGYSTIQALALITLTPGDYLYLFSSLVLAPLVETLVLPFVRFSARKLVRRSAWVRTATILFYAGLGWVAHGANTLSVGHSIGFGILAVFFLGVAERRGGSLAYWLTALAHLVWNAVALAMIITLTGGYGAPH